MGPRRLAWVGVVMLVAACRGEVDLGGAGSGQPDDDAGAAGGDGRGGGQVGGSRGGASGVGGSPENPDSGVAGSPGFAGVGGSAGSPVPPDPVADSGTSNPDPFMSCVCPELLDYSGGGVTMAAVRTSRCVIDLGPYACSAAVEEPIEFGNYGQGSLVTVPGVIDRSGCEANGGRGWFLSDPGVSFVFELCPASCAEIEPGIANIYAVITVPLYSCRWG